MHLLSFIIAPVRKNDEQTNEENYKTVRFFTIII